MILDYIQIMRHDFFNALENVFPPIAVGKTPYEVVDEGRPFEFKREASKRSKGGYNALVF